MKKLFMGVVVLATGLAAQAAIWWTSNPGSATSGGSYYISASASSDYSYGSAELYITKNGTISFAYGYGYSGAVSAGASSTDYGAQTVNYTAEAYFEDSPYYDSTFHSVTIVVPNSAPTITWTSAPANAAVNEWFNIEARGNDPDGNLSNVFVWREWVPHAFAGGGNGYEGYSGNGSSSGTAGTVTFMAQSKDSGDEYSPVIYHSVNIYVPNVAPTVTWVNNPASAWVNQSFNIQARANDGNGNLTWIYVWKNDQPFAFNGGGNGWEAYSDNNGASSATPTTIAFKAKAGDSNGAESGFIYHNVSINNRAPTVSGSATNAVAGAPITVSWSASDPDGNLSNVQIWVTQWGSPYWDPIGTFGASGSTQWSSSAHFNSNNPASGAYLFVIRANDAAGAYTDYYATFNITNQAPHSPGISAVLTSGVTYNSIGGHYEMWAETPITLNATLQDADGNLVFHANYHNAGTGQTSGSPSPWQQMTNGTPSNGANSALNSTYSPLTPGRWDFHTNGRDAAGVWANGASITTYVYGPTNNAAFVTQTVNNLANPASISVQPGQTFPVSITMRNNGDKPWNSDGTPHRLGAVNDVSTWGLARVALPVSVVNPLPQTGSDATFNFTATAPTAPGNYTFIWKMVEDGIQWFGAYTPAVTVTVANVAPVVVSATGGTIAYGQSFSTTLRATDANADLTNFHLVVANSSFATNNWEGTSPDGWKWRHFRTNAVSGGDASITVPVQDFNYGTANPLPAGTYRLTLNAQDSLPNYAYSASNVLATLTVAKATPVGTFANRTVNASGLGYTVQAADLNAVFANPYSGSALAPTGAITYSLVGPGTAVVAGTTLSSGQAYTVRASYAGDANYNGATVDAVFTVSVDPVADNDSDGMPNGWESANGLNPASSADGMLDPDSDGLTNVAEYNLQTNPQVYNQGTGPQGGALPAGWPNTDANPTLAVGATAGTLSVDKSGAATYSVPLWATPGTAGMQPQLSLNYSSQAGAGIAGFGWSLGGVSAITRGPQTLAIDGKNKGVTLTTDDRFYLDGQRLILVSAGNYGDAGTEYRTELDSISKVVANGAAGAGPASFTVWTKAGLIIQFGQTAASAAEATGTATIRTWAVNRIADTKGNYMDFTYDEDATQGEQRLTRIDYTGNTSAAVSPYASVRFTYEARADKFYGYQAGSAVSSTQRLKTVATYWNIPETKAREYILDYVERANTGRSILTGIRERDGSTPVKEYPPLSFNYEAATTGWDQDANWGAPATITKHEDKPRGTGFVDLNGDARTDFVQFHRAGTTDTRGAWLNTPAGWVVADGTVAGVPDFRLPAPLATDDAPNNDNGNRLTDVNADGLPDLFAASSSQGAGRFYRNTGSGFELDSAWELPLPAASQSGYQGGTATLIACSKAMFADLNGDGRVDLAAKILVRYWDQYEMLPQITEQKKIAWLNTGTGWALSSTYYPQFDLDKGSRFVDVNGDGLPDQVQHWRDQGTILKGVALNTGSGWNVLAANSVEQIRYLPPVVLNENNLGTDSATVGTELADLNGDGLMDLIHRYTSPGLPAPYGTNTAWLNTGYGWIAAPSSYLSPYELAANGVPQGVAFLDMNTDGLADLVYSWDATGRDVRLNTGQGWGASVSNYNLVRQMSQPNRPSTGTDFVDLDADGIVDQCWNYLEDGLTTKGAAFNRNRTTDRLQTVTNGFGVAATIAYAPLTGREANGDYTVYEKGTGGPAGSVNAIGPMWVVKSVTHDDGVGGQYALTYRYGGLRSDLLRGSLGFEWQKVTDGRTAIVSKTTFSQAYPFIGMPVASETKTGATTLSSSSINYAEVTGMAAGTHLPYASQSVESSHELNGTLIVTTTTSVTDIDVYGNVKAMNVTTSDGFTKSTTNTYTEDNVGSWLLGRLTTSSVTSSAPSVPSVTRNSLFHYNATTGLLETETVEPNDATNTLKLTTTYGYDAFGNKTSVQVSGATVTVTNSNGDLAAGAPVSRTTTTQYDPRGRFPIWTENALGHRENYTEYDQALGVLKAMTGANGLPTSWGYDGFGRKTSETRADGTHSYTTYRWANTAPGGAATYPGGTAPTVKYSIETTADGAPPSLAFHDSFGRAFLSLGLNGNGAIVHQAVTFDAMGRDYAKSNPYLNNGSTIHWSVTTLYDLLNRPKTVTTPDDQNGAQTTTLSYAGLTTTVTDAKGRISKTVKNSQGWTTENVRNTGINGANSGGDDYSRVAYTYDALGNLTQTNAAGVVTTLGYDLRGRKMTMTDADMGTWQYRYNIFGELIWQKDAKGQVSTLAYDSLGRLVTRVERNDANTADETTSWTYDTSPKPGGGVWKGKLHTVAAPGGYAENYAYDQYGRPKTLSRTPDSGSGTYVTETGYDTVGRPNRVIYPATGLSAEPFSVRQVYNAFGYLKEVRFWLDSDSALTSAQLQGKVYWQADHYDQSGRIDSETLGNGLANLRGYSAATGRLAWARIDRGSVFDLNPLPASFAVQHLDYTYDAVGNVVRRLDSTPGFARDEQFYTTTPGDGYDGLDRLRVHRVVGGATVTVGYDQKGNITSKSDVGSYTYSGVNAGPHAVTTAGVKTYQYDLNGNMTFGGGRTITWTSFNQVRKATDDATARSSEFFFGAGHERVKQIRRNGTTVLDVTFYIGSLYEKVTTTATSLVEHKHYIMTPTGRVAAFTDRSTLVKDTRFFHTDGLGSITVISDEAGRVLKRYAYDAWGKQETRYTYSGAGITNQAPTTRGFTDHEMLSDLGLVHMNGRVYDPVLGRFLSADPNIDGAEDSQGYNRYSYVGNNPLGATDPTGYFRLSFKTVLKIVAVVAVAYFTGVWAQGAWGTTTVATSTTVSATGSVTIGTSWASSALLSAGFSAGVTNGIIAGFAGGFASGFAGSLLNGGSIGDAFKSGAIGSVAGAITGGIAGRYQSEWGLEKIAAKSTAGGLSSEIQGGDWRIGAAFALAMESLGWVNYSARKAMIKDSMKYTDKVYGKVNAAGQSRSFWRDFFKLGGARHVEGADWATELQNPKASPLGRMQGGKGWIKLPGVTYDYSPGSFGDNLVEAYSGPHDFLNSFFFYNSSGNNIPVDQLSGFVRNFSTIINGMNVVLATPFAAGAAYSNYSLIDPTVVAPGRR